MDYSAWKIHILDLAQDDTAIGFVCGYPMHQSKFTETQIVSLLKEADAGRPVNEIWRKYGISSATYYKWKAKYGGLEASDIKRLKELEHENGRL